MTPGSKHSSPSAHVCGPQLSWHPHTWHCHDVGCRSYERSSQAASGSPPSSPWQHSWAVGSLVDAPEEERVKRGEKDIKCIFVFKHNKSFCIAVADICERKKNNHKEAFWQPIREYTFSQECSCYQRISDQSLGLHEWQFSSELHTSFHQPLAKTFFC